MTYYYVCNKYKNNDCSVDIFCSGDCDMYSFYRIFINKGGANRAELVPF